MVLFQECRSGNQGCRIHHAVLPFVGQGIVESATYGESTRPALPVKRQKAHLTVFEVLALGNPPHGGLAGFLWTGALAHEFHHQKAAADLDDHLAHARGGGSADRAIHIEAGPDQGAV